MKTRFYTTLTLLALVALGFSSCQKEWPWEEGKGGNGGKGNTERMIQAKIEGKVIRGDDALDAMPAKVRVELVSENGQFVEEAELVADGGYFIYETKIPANQSVIAYVVVTDCNGEWVEKQRALIQDGYASLTFEVCFDNASEGREVTLYGMVYSPLDDLRSYRITVQPANNRVAWKETFATEMGGDYKQTITIPEVVGEYVSVFTYDDCLGKNIGEEKVYIGKGEAGVDFDYCQRR